MQDPNPLPWGALDRFQAHFIVRKEVTNPKDYVARTILNTKGHFSAKKVISVKWIGGRIADVLNGDADLNSKISKLSPNDATIYVEPTNTGVRIRNKWKNHLEFKIDKETFNIYDCIAGHIKSL